MGTGYHPDHMSHEPYELTTRYLQVDSRFFKMSVDDESIVAPALCESEIIPALTFVMLESVTLQGKNLSTMIIGLSYT